MKFLIINMFSGRKYIVNGKSQKSIERRMGQRSLDVLIQPYCDSFFNKEKSLSLLSLKDILQRPRTT